MSSPIETLFALTLGLEAPRQVENITFSKVDKRLDIHLDSPRGCKLTCPVCSRKGAQVGHT